jgi:hypothetical protein
MSKRRRPNDITVYFNEERPFDLTILSAIERIRDGTLLSKGSAAKRLLMLGALIVRGVDARSFIPSMKLGAASERWRLEQRLRGVQPDSQPNNPACSATQDESTAAMPDLRCRKSHEVTVYFNEQEQPFDSTTLYAVKELREGASLSKGSGAKRLMTLGALVLGDIDARPFIHTVKFGTASERWQLERRLCSGQPDSSTNNPHSSATAAVPSVTRGPAQDEPHDKTAAATLELAKPIQLREELSRTGAATEHIAPPAVSKSPARGLLSQWKGMAISRGVEEFSGDRT